MSDPKSFHDSNKDLYETLCSDEDQTTFAQSAASGNASPAGTGIVPTFGFSSISASRSDDEDEDDDENDGTTIIASQLSKVTLSKEKLKEYKATFYPKSPNAFLPVLEALPEVSARLNGVFGLLRYCLVNARRLAVMSKQDRAADLNSKAERILTNSMAGSLDSYLTNFLELCNTGKNHVLQPSKRYKGGYDILFVGAPASPASPTDPLPSVNVPFFEYSINELTPTGRSENSIYKQEYLEAYSTELSLGAVAAGREILNLLLGAERASVQNAHQRVFRNVPLNFDFSSINDIILKHTGVVLHTDFMKNIDPSVTKAFGSLFSLVVIRTPKATLLRHVMDKQTQMRYASADGNTPPLPPNFMEELVTPEAAALSQTLSLSFALNLTAETARYISQAEASEKIPVASLYNWTNIWVARYIRRKGARTEGGRVRLSEMPKFVPPVSQTAKISELRAQNDFHVEPGKGDENGIFIAPDGTLQFGLGTEAKDQIEENLLGYERDLEEYLTFCFEHGIPPSPSSSLPPEVALSSGNANVAEEYRKLHDRMKQYSGKILAYDWDYNIQLTANVVNPSAIVTHDLVGAAKPDIITIADYLGYDFAKEGESPIRKSFADSIVLMTQSGTPDKPSAVQVSDGEEIARFISSAGALSDVLPFYAYNLIKGRVPSAQELVNQAAKELGLSSLDPIQQQIIGGLIDENFRVSGQLTANGQIATFLLSCVSRTLSHCNGGPILRQQVFDENEGISLSDLADEIQNHPNYFNPNTSPAADFGRLYNFVGGLVWRIAMEKLLAIPKKDLFSVEEPVGEGRGVTKLHKASYGAVTKRIIPAAVMFAKYIPNSETILQQAELAVEANESDPSIDVSDIQIPAGIEGSQMFPHQVRAHGSLRKRPAFSIMDIGAGGGKTSLGVTDIAALVKELDELQGPTLKPLLLVPDGLIKNWVDDLKIFTGDNWNMIPINSKILARWGYEKLNEVITNAPRNTIVVCGFNFLSAKKETIVIGTRSISISNNLEFIKRFKFNYICIDESHKLKNRRSQRHRSVKQLTTGSHVLYLRLATGTLISDRVTDVVGQASLYNGHIFREGEVATSSSKEREEIILNGDYIPVWSVDTPQRARQKLSRYAAVITMKKKEWAFMLPNPIETFIGVPMVPGEDATPEEVRLGELHQQLYDAVLQESLEDLEALMRKARKGRSSDDDDDSDDDDSDDSPDLEIEEGSDLANISLAELTPYLARIERLVTNPMADPLAPDVFGAAGVTEYHSTKARYISKRIDQHFNPEKWNKDKLYKEFSFVEHAGNLYLARKRDKGSYRPEDLPPETRGVSPDVDTETWKLEPRGKIIVFCRYTNSVNGVYNALPERYKNVAVKFTGEEDDKWANLDAFLYDPKVTILVANEMGIAEGHNMQVGSRLIRVESPWAPGDLDQSSARIFRPDPKAAKEMINSGKPGELAREAIFLDWILCDNSMEVAKQARLIAKIFNKARFDEAENELYSDVLESYDLDEIRMSLDTLRSRASLSDFSEYVNAYAALNGVQRQEFHQMRVNMDHTMKSLEPADALPDFRKIPVPFVSNQKPNGVPGLTLVSLRTMLRNEEHADLRSNPSALEGRPVVTDLGNANIVSVRPRYQKRAMLDENGNVVRNPSRTGKPGTIRKVDVLDAYGRKVVDPDNPISSVRVKLVETGEVISIPDPGVLFMPLNLDNATAKRMFSKAKRTPAVSDKENRRRAKEEAAEEKRLAKEEERELIRKEKQRRKEKEQLKARSAANADGKKRADNIRRGKPINSGIRRVDEVPPIKRGRMGQDEDGDMVVTLHPAYYHGFLTLEMQSTDTDPKIAKKLGFKETGPYAYVTADRYARFDKVLDYIEQHFHISDASARRLEEVQDAFDTGPKEIYRMELMQNSALPMFFTINKRRVTNPKEIRPYPIIMPNELQIAVDLTTSPAVRKHIGKAVPGAVTKWKEHPGHFLFFAQSKADLRAKIRDVKAAGLMIANEDVLKAEITAIKFRAPKPSKKK